MAATKTKTKTTGGSGKVKQHFTFILAICVVCTLISFNNKEMIDMMNNGVTTGSVSSYDEQQVIIKSPSTTSQQQSSDEGNGGEVEGEGKGYYYGYGEGYGYGGDGVLEEDIVMKEQNQNQNSNSNNNNNNYIMVTGVAGYIGSHVALELLNLGYVVIGVDNLSRGSMDAIQVLQEYESNFIFHFIDLGNKEAVNDLFEQYAKGQNIQNLITNVIHLAAISFTSESEERPDLYKHNITTNTEILVDTMIRHQVPNLIYSSTCAVYGQPSSNELPITEDTPTNPISVYGQAKLAAETYIKSKTIQTKTTIIQNRNQNQQNSNLRQQQQQQPQQNTNNNNNYQFQAKILRYFNVIGSDFKYGGQLKENPRNDLNQYGRLWTTILDVVKGKRPCVPLKTTTTTPDQTTIRDFIHIDDIVQAHIKVLNIDDGVNDDDGHVNDDNNNFRIWNVGHGHPTSIMEFVESARRVTNMFIPICFSNDNSNSNSNSNSEEEEEEGTGGDEKQQKQAQQQKQKQRNYKKDPDIVWATGDKLRNDTGWEPKFINIDTMLQTAWKTQSNDTKNEIYDQIYSKEYDVCIAGGGLSAAVLAERHSTTLNHSVLVVEKRNHIGGNCYDYIDKPTGIRVSKYGIHLFHTKYSYVWDYINKFSHWTKWEHRVIAKIDNIDNGNGTGKNDEQHQQHGVYVPVPINIDSVNTIFNLNITSTKEMKEFMNTIQIVPPNNMTAENSEEVALQRVGNKMYEIIFKPYTYKQWNKDPSELGPSVLARIPIRMNHDGRYFTDQIQAYPTYGYTRIFENMFSISPQIKVLLNTDYFDIRNKLNCNHIYFTGPIDNYFASQGFDLPKLEYRSLEFTRVQYNNTKYYQPRAHVNYPSLKYNYTRAIEYKHVLNQTSKDTVVFFERSTDNGEPYYPVPNKRNQDLYEHYKSLADKLKPNVTFVGRLANYKYFNMDETIKNALELFYNETGNGGVMEN